MNLIRRMYAWGYSTISRIFVLHSPAITLDFFYKKYRKKGEKIYSNIKKKFGEDSYLVLCPYPGTGDVYIASMYMEEYMKKNHIQNIVWIIIGTSNKKVIQLFGYDQVYKLSPVEMHDLVKFLLFLGVDEKKFLLAHPSAPYMHYGINDMMRNYGKLNFADMYSYGVFGLKNKCSTSKLNFAEKNEDIDRFIVNNKIKKNKTVVLSPYANTLQLLPDWFWRKLTNILKEKGYCVLTNSNGQNEPVIDGTIGVFLQYKDLKYFLEYCGYFVGIRSGLCDIISSFKCKKIIIYQPYCFWGPGGNYDYFSLNIMGLCDDAIELNYEGMEFVQLIKDIIKEF